MHKSVHLKMSGNRSRSLSATAGTRNIQCSLEVLSSKQSNNKTSKSGKSIYWWLLLDNGGITLNSEILKLESVWREKKTLTLLQVKKKKRKEEIMENNI